MVFYTLENRRRVYRTVNRNTKKKWTKILRKTLGQCMKKDFITHWSVGELCSPIIKYSGACNRLL